MVDTGYPSIDRTVDKTNRLLREIEEINGWDQDQRQHSYASLRAVLHAVRDRLTVDQSAHLAAQLPTLVRGLYYDGWRPATTPQKMHRQEFLDRIRAELPFLPPTDDGEAVTRSVLHVLREHVTPGEWEKVTDAFPRDLVDLVA